MKAAVLYELGKPLRWMDVPTPIPTPDQALVQVMACGIDGTDLKILEGFGYTPQLPAIIGHEIAGIVSQVGERVTRFKPGERVVIYNFVNCGSCPLCLLGRDQICANLKGVMGAKGLPGGYSEYVSVQENQLVALPENVPWPDAATCCDAGLTTVHALDRARLKLGESVLVIGTGGVGSVTLQLANAMGAFVIGVNRTAKRQQWAYANGADVVLNSGEVDIPSAVLELTHGLGVDCVLDVVGNRETISCGVASLRHGGRLVIVGYTPETYPVEGKYFAQNELELIGTRAGSKQDLIRTVQLMANGTIKSVVTDTFPMEEANEALKHLSAGQSHGRIIMLSPAGQQAV